MPLEYNPNEELKQTSDMSRTRYASFIAGKIATDSNLLNTIIVKHEDDITENDRENLQKIEMNHEYISSLKKVIPRLAPATTVLLNTVKRTLDGYTSAFMYAPLAAADSVYPVPNPTVPGGSNSFRTNTRVSNNPGILEDVSDYDLIMNNSDFVTGFQRFTNGIADDLRDNSTKPTLKLTGESESSPGVPYGFLHEPIDIGTGYSINFKFRLNKFPSKVYKNIKNYEYSQTDNREIIDKKLTSRRSDLITFNYTSDNGRENKVEFAAIAPRGINSDQLSNLRNRDGRLKKYENINFENKFSPFSIAASITNPISGHKFTFYTDYKFELGTWYTVNLHIEKADDSYNYCAGMVQTFENTKYQFNAGDEISESVDRSLLRDFQKIKYELGLRKDEWSNNQQFNFINRVLVEYDNQKYNIGRFVDYINVSNDSRRTFPKFGNSGLYNIGININGMPENIAIYHGKLWGNKFNRERKREVLGSSGDNLPNSIATMPGFKSINLKTVSNTKTVTKRFNILDFKQLESIYTAPYPFNTQSMHIMDSENELNSSNYLIHKRLYNRYLHRMNNGVDFGEIDIKYTPTIYSISSTTGNTTNQILSANNKEELNDIIWQLEGVLYNRREAKNLEVIGLPNGFNWNVEQSQGPAYMVSLTDIGNGEISRDLQYRLIITGNANNDSVPGVYEFTINLKDQFDNISATTKGSFEIINDEETTQVEESPE